MSGPYDDIINLPHHVSATRPQMPIADRAAQFSPFAALTGHTEAIAETARITDKRIALDEDRIAALNIRLCILADAIRTHPQVAITHFQQDAKKEGGAYVTSIGAVKRIEAFEGVVVFMNGERITITDILDIEGELFKALM